jgi:hypothetical protein
MYANPKARKVSPEELVKAQATWRNFLTKLLAVIRSDSEQFRAKNGVLDTERNFGHALIQLSVSEEAYGDAQLISEIHQVQSSAIMFCFSFFSSPVMSSFTRCFRTSLRVCICVCVCKLCIHLYPVCVTVSRTCHTTLYTVSCLSALCLHLHCRCCVTAMRPLRALCLGCSTRSTATLRY